MKKSFFVLSLIGVLGTTGVQAASVGEVMGVSSGGYMACPPECKFLRNDNGGLVTPLTCVDRGIECAGGNRGIKFFEEYPTKYATGEAGASDKPGEVIPVKKLEKETTFKAEKKMDFAPVARAAKSGAKAKKAAGLTTTAVSAQATSSDAGAVAINCPANCTPDCAVLSNVVLCECKDSKGDVCKAEVVLSDKDTSVVAPK